MRGPSPAPAFAFRLRTQDYAVAGFGCSVGFLMKNGMIAATISMTATHGIAPVNEPV